MFDKLEQVEQKYQELTDRLSSPGLSAADLQKFAKEQSSLRETVETYQRLKKSKKELEDNKGLLQTENDEAMRSMAKEEISSLEKNILELEAKLKILLLPTDPNDEKNTILEIRAGTGGDEAALFVADLFRMYSRYAETKGWRVEVLSDNPTGKGGLKEVIALITGERVYSCLKYESGIHRVQRVPDTEASGRIHTSAVTVAILPEAEDVEVNVPETDLKIDVMRAGGAGGQHVNKTESAVRITHLPTGLVVLCRDERSQHKNKARAMTVLKSRLLDLYQTEASSKEAANRKSMIGSGDRSEKIRTYNFPQSRVTDHRINVTLYNLNDVLDGNLKPLIEPLTTYYQAQLMGAS